MYNHPLLGSTPFRFSVKSFVVVRFLLIALAIASTPLAFARAHPVSLNQSNPQTAAQSNQEAAALEAGKPVERELAGGQAHSYQITLAAGQYLNVVVEQRGIDVVVMLFGPDGKKLIEVDSPNGDQGPEPLKWIVETAGIYRIEVRSLENDAKPGRYEAKIVELRAATDRDRDLAEADKLYNESISLRGKGRYSQAIPLAERALMLREKTLGAEHPETANSLDNLATLYNTKGDYAQAEPLSRRALAICEKTLGAEHPDTAKSLNNLAKLDETTGDISRAVTLRSRAQAIEEHNISVNLAAGSERQRLAYLATLAASSYFSVNLHARSAPYNSTARDLALTAILQRKGRVLDAMNDSVEALRRRANPQDRALFDQLKNSRAQLARLVLGGLQKASPAEYQQAIKRLEESVEKLEVEIGNRSSEFRVQSQPVTLAAVQSAIPADAALVEFFAYRPYNVKFTSRDEQLGQPRYVAYVLRRQGEARWVELGEARAIDDAVGVLRKALRHPKRADVKRLARRVDKLVMQPVHPLLGKTRRVFISPDGALNLAPFAALVDERNRYLVGRYEFSYLTSGRDLLRLQAPRASKQKAMVMANPDFNMSASEGHAADRSLGLLQVSKTSATSLANAYFAPLPGTAGEARALKALLLDAVTLTKAQATEAALKQVSSPRILHIATHGFFLEDLATPSTESRGLGLSGDATSSLPGNFRIENPLLRSGLALAGANLRKSGPNQDDDGILTAAEAAGLDLWGTKLVVLSACDTGVGEVKNGEGVYGLRRALVLAGSETQVMSLWPVSDRGTRDWMTAYYRALQSGEGRSEALRRVQLRMLASARRGHPFYWAGFIQSGEWKKLD